MRPFDNVAVSEVFEAYPANMRIKLLALRELIFETAGSIQGVGKLEETLKWGEPAYVTSQSKSGSTVRIDWEKSNPSRYAMYFNCKTTLIDTFRTVFPSEFKFEGNRAIVFDESDVVSTEALAFCVAAALTYHSKRPLTHHSSGTPNGAP
ncbi:DUF1801 domain-containing protein [Methylophilus sp. UBA6697]|jgi:hypothetical protein|uniref:DUF1801 domain-containing protein n=1 Tax=Methylophilus sp. UBA6697 TaxID=1946902 RepID=UPI000EC6B325|nr:DUF1801 domain-containing protein [Methylophilus sp. UBA6697]HCU84352.1 hypothetical protein [Methylophilus sp.]